MSGDTACLNLWWTEDNISLNVFFPHFFVVFLYLLLSLLLPLYLLILSLSLYPPLSRAHQTHQTDPSALLEMSSTEGNEDSCCVHKYRTATQNALRDSNCGWKIDTRTHNRTQCILTCLTRTHTDITQTKSLTYDLLSFPVLCTRMWSALYFWILVRQRTPHCISTLYC